MINLSGVRKVLSYLVAVSLLKSGGIYILWFVMPLISFYGSASGYISFISSYVEIFGKPVNLTISYLLKVYLIPVLVMSVTSIVAGVYGLMYLMRKRRYLYGRALWLSILAGEISVIGSGYGMGILTLIMSYASHVTREVVIRSSAGVAVFPPIIARPGLPILIPVPLISYIGAIIATISSLIIIWSLEREGLLSWGGD